jgi:hypothetical protein
LSIPVQDVRDGKRYVKMGHTIYKDLLEDVKKRALELESQTIASHLLRIKDPKTGKAVPDEYLLPEIAMFFLAGEKRICPTDYPAVSQPAHIKLKHMFIITTKAFLCFHLYLQLRGHTEERSARVWPHVEGETATDPYWPFGVHSHFLSIFCDESRDYPEYVRVWV